jgi:hypothetical protein
MTLRNWSRCSPWIGALCLTAGVAQADIGCSAGYPSTTPSTDFADAGNGTVRHIPTGLIWKRCTEGQTWSGSNCIGTPIDYSWEQAFARALAVNAANPDTENAGQTDWRLPNINELKSIVEHACGGPSINFVQFPQTPQSEYYWSSTPRADSSDEAHRLYFWDGLDYWDNRSAAYKVRLVRAGLSYSDYDDANAAPTATSLGIAGSAQVGATLTGSYVYGDTDSDPQDTSGVGTSYRFVSSTDNSVTTGGDNTDVANGTTGGSNKTYTIRNGDLGKHLFYCITPKASTGRSPGGEACSSATTIVTGAIGPSAPALTSISSGPGRAILNFTAASTNGGTPISSYTAACSATGEATRTATGISSPITVRNLTGGVAYQCMVTATNGAGLTSSASVSLPVTPAPRRLGGISWILMLLD